MSEELRIKVHLARQHRRSAELREGAEPPREATRYEPTPARAARHLAMAHRVSWLVEEGALPSYAEAARVGGVTRARLAQLMNLLLLAPDIQETVLFEVRPERGHERVTERALRAIALEPDWSKQRQRFARLMNGK